MIFRKTVIQIVFVLLALCLVSCGGTGSGGDTSETDTVTEAAVVIAEKGETDYVVIRPMNATSAEKDCAAAIKRVIEAFTGKTAKISDDYLYQNEKPGEKEILIGATNRQESKDASNLLPENGYGVFVMNGKITVCGRDDNLLGIATDYLISQVLGFDITENKFAGSKTVLSVPETLSYVSRWSSPIEGYNIVYPYGEYRSREYVSARLLQEKIENTAGIRLKVSDDYENIENEILIGLTKRQESKQIYESLDETKFGGYARIGNKVLIFGITDSALDAACDYFVNTVLGYDSVSQTKIGKVDYSLLEKETVVYIDGSKGSAERLYNNILLPEVWPPHTVD